MFVQIFGYKSFNHITRLCGSCIHDIAHFDNSVFLKRSTEEQFKMFAVIFLFEANQNLVIPVKWIKSFDIIQAINRGISHTKVHKVFYCNDFSLEPNFNTPMRQEFQAENTGCYDANIKYIFGKPFISTSKITIFVILSLSFVRHIRTRNEFFAIASPFVAGDI